MTIISQARSFASLMAKVFRSKPAKKVFRSKPAKKVKRYPTMVVSSPKVIAAWNKEVAAAKRAGRLSPTL